MVIVCFMPGYYQVDTVDTSGHGQDDMLFSYKLVCDICEFFVANIYLTNSSLPFEIKSSAKKNIKLFLFLEPGFWTCSSPFSLFFNFKVRLKMRKRDKNVSSHRLRIPVRFPSKTSPIQILHIPAKLCHAQHYPYKYYIFL